MQLGGLALNPETRGSAATSQPGIVVVGGGISGMFAALTASRAGASVSLVKGRAGATNLCAGGLDVIALRPGDSARVVLEALLSSRPLHAYASLARGLRAVGARSKAAASDSELLHEGLETALGILAEDLGSQGLGHRVELCRAFLLPGPAGELHVVSGAAEALARGCVARAADGGRAVAVVPLQGVDWPQIGIGGILEAFHAGGVTAHGSKVAVAPPSGPAAAILPGAFGLACGLDHLEPERILAWAREQLAPAVANLVDGDEPLVLVPAVLGLSEHGAVVEAVDQGLRVGLGRAGAQVAEALALPPSVPGARLVAGLERAVEAAGVELIEGEVSEICRAGSRGHVTRVSVSRSADGEKPKVTRLVDAGALVLACGRFLGGGLVAQQVPAAGVREGILDLPLFDGAGRALERATLPWFTAALAAPGEGPHPILASGLAVDEWMRVVDEAGAVVSGNLFASGETLAGHDYATDGAGLGLAVLGAWLAGRAASAHLQRSGGLGTPSASDEAPAVPV